MGSGRLATGWPVAVALAAVIAIVYANGLHAGFHFDDWHVLQDNPHVRSLASIPRFFVHPDTTTVLHENKDLRPVLMTTFALNYAVSGIETWSYHIVNMILHWLAVLLVYRIVRDHLWLGEDAAPVAIAAALIVAVHPLNTETVVYLSARSALLTTVFYLAAFDAGLRAQRVACISLFVLALLTKAIAITMPLALLGYWLVARRRPLPWRFLSLLAAVAVAGILYRALLLPPWTLETSHQPGISSRVYLMTEWSAYLYYLRLFLWPDALVLDRVDYPYAYSLSDPQAWVSLVVLVALATLAWLTRRRWPALTFSALWYALTLSAESTIFPLAEPVNEHRPYLAMLGLGAAAGFACWRGARLAARAVQAPPMVVFALVVAAVAGPLGVAAGLRNSLWCDDYALWLDATRKAPGNTRAWLNAGHAALAAGRPGEARSLLLEARRLSPCYAYVQINLSVLEARAGKREASLEWVDEAVRCNPGLALVHYYRGAALERLGRYAEALAEYRACTTIDVQHADAWEAQGRLHEGEGRWREAAVAYEHARAANPVNVEASMLSALLRHYRLGDPTGAVERYREVLRLMPSHYGAHYQLAKALLASGRTEDAIVAWRAFLPLAEATGDRASIDGAPEVFRTTSH
jgi:Tfp pilus assembly protein PilF